MSTSTKALAALQGVAAESAARMEGGVGRQPVSLGWHEDVLIELRRIRQAVEKIAGMEERLPVATEHGDLLVNRWGEPVGHVEDVRERLDRLAAQRADPDGEFAVEVSVKNDNMGGLSAERLEELTRRCAEAPRE